MNESKQLAADNHQLRIDRDSLMQQLNGHILEEKNSSALAYEVDRLNSLVRIKDNEIEQLKLVCEQPPQVSVAQSENSIKVGSLERRVEMLAGDLEKSNNALLNKNKEILELKSLNFELEKLSKNNIELKSAEYQVTKLT